MRQNTYFHTWRQSALARASRQRQTGARRPLDTDTLCPASVPSWQPSLTQSPAMPPSRFPFDAGNRRRKPTLGRNLGLVDFSILATRRSPKSRYASEQMALG